MDKQKEAHEFSRTMLQTSLLGDSNCEGSPKRSATADDIIENTTLEPTIGELVAIKTDGSFGKVYRLQGEDIILSPLRHHLGENGYKFTAGQTRKVKLGQILFPIDYTYDKTANLYYIRYKF